MSSSVACPRYVERGLKSPQPLQFFLMTSQVPISNFLLDSAQDYLCEIGGGCQPYECNFTLRIEPVNGY